VNIKILGTGCPNCKRLKENTKIAVNELGVKAEVEEVTDIPKIMSYGVMSTPALVVNEKVVSVGVLSPKEIKKFLE